jgi:acetolactate synthase regulatory subunit
MKCEHQQPVTLLRALEMTKRRHAIVSMMQGAVAQRSRQ